MRHLVSILLPGVVTSLAVGACAARAEEPKAIDPRKAIVLVSERLVGGPDKDCLAPIKDPQMKAACAGLPSREEREKLLADIRTDFSATAECAGLTLVPEAPATRTPELRETFKRAAYRLLLSSVQGLRRGHVSWILIEGNSPYFLVDSTGTPQQIVKKACSIANGLGGRVIQ